MYTTREISGAKGCIMDSFIAGICLAYWNGFLSSPFQRFSCPGCTRDQFPPARTILWFNWLLNTLGFNRPSQVMEMFYLKKKSASYWLQKPSSFENKT